MKEAPSTCGVYLMKDSEGNVIYVGKAKNIRKRLTSYFKTGEKRYQVNFLLKKLDKIEFFITNTEKEALILENNLIKKFNPKYNIQLKDDKNYLCIKIDIKKDFPKIELVRKADDKDALYFGPYPSAKKIREIISTLQKIFPLRHCSDKTFYRKTKPCIYLDIGQCIAPCVDGDKKKEEYKKILDNVILFLEGKATNKIKSLLKKKMWEASQRLDYEKAGFIRDIIFQIDELIKSQSVQSNKLKNIDVIGFFDAIDHFNVSMLFIRAGKLLHKKDFSIKKGIMQDTAISEFIMNYYSKNVVIPDEIIIEGDIENKDEIENYILETKNRRVKIRKPYDSQTKQLLEMAKLNAGNFSTKTHDGLVVLKNIFNLPKKPERIECYDATHFQGMKNACVMVVYENNEFAKENYRIFNISKEGFDDYMALYETFIRRFNHKEWRYPDILVVDGGKGQLSVAKKVLDELKIDSVYPIAISKDEKNSIYIPGRKNPIVLQRENPGLKILIKLREEAHRFANMHLKRRLKKYFFD